MVTIPKAQRTRDLPRDLTTDKEWGSFVPVDLRNLSIEDRQRYENLLESFPRDRRRYSYIEVCLIHTNHLLDRDIHKNSRIDGRNAQGIERKLEDKLVTRYGNIPTDRQAHRIYQHLKSKKRGKWADPVLYACLADRTAHEVNGYEKRLVLSWLLRGPYPLRHSQRKWFILSCLTGRNQDDTKRCFSRYIRPSLLEYADSYLRKVEKIWNLDMSPYEELIGTLQKRKIPIQRILAQRIIQARKHRI